MTDTKEHMIIGWRSSSPSTPKLDAAIALVQGEIEAAKKEGLNPHLGNRYADLSAVIDACREPLSKAGIARYQPVWTDDRPGVVVTTRLALAGEWVEADLRMPVNKNDAQAVGSAITYGKRYGLTAILGISTDDDDGNAATASPPAKPPKRQTRAAAPRTAAKPTDIGPRCTGKGEPIAIAIDELATELSGLIKRDKALIYRSAVKAASIDLAPYDNVAPNPSGLLIDDGKAVKAKLEAKLAEVTRQPGDDGDDPTGEAAP